MKRTARLFSKPRSPPPVDTARVADAEIAAAFPCRREASADLDGDGIRERVVIAADVLSEKKVPLGKMRREVPFGRPLPG